MFYCAKGSKELFNLKYKKNIRGEDRLLKLARLQLVRIVLAAFCMAVGALATASFAFLVGPVLKALFLGIDGAESIPVAARAHFLVDVADRVGRANIWTVGVLIIVTAMIKGGAFFGGRVLVINAGQRILLNLRASLYSGLLAMNPLSSKVRARGELVSRYTVDVEMVEQAVSSGLLSMVRDGLQIVALAGLALMLDLRLGLLGMVVFPLIAVIIIKVGRELRRRKREVFDAFSQIGGVVDETAAGLCVIRSFGAEQLIGKRFAAKNEALMKRAARAMTLKAFSSPFNEVLGSAALAGTLFYARSRIDQGTLTPEVFISFFTALILLYQPVKGLGSAQHVVQSGLAALDRLAFLLEMSPVEKDRTCEDVSDSTKRITLWGKEISPPPLIELKAITAGYSLKGPLVLNNLDLSLAPGVKLALVGPSGCGKSTLINFLGGNLCMSSGEVFVEGEQIEPASFAAAGLFAPVSQESFLFNDTVLLNVMCGRPDATVDEVKLACQTAGVLDFADLNDCVGVGGADLSLGQRQRVCLARALVSHAPVLLLDEFTASLDGETERALIDRLTDHVRDRTVLVVTHRYSTASWADELAFIDKGFIQTRGKSKTLLNNDSRIIELFGGQTNP